MCAQVRAAGTEEGHDDGRLVRDAGRLLPQFDPAVAEVFLSLCPDIEQVIEREVGYAILRAEGFETTDESVFAQPTDLHLLGVRTIEGFSLPAFANSSDSALYETTNRLHSGTVGVRLRPVTTRRPDLDWRSWASRSMALTS